MLSKSTPANVLCANIPLVFISVPLNNPASVIVCEVEAVNVFATTILAESLRLAVALVHVTVVAVAIANPESVAARIGVVRVVSVACSNVEPVPSSMAVNGTVIPPVHTVVPTSEPNPAGENNALNAQFSPVFVMTLSVCL